MWAGAAWEGCERSTRACAPRSRHISAAARACWRPGQSQHSAPPAASCRPLAPRWRPPQHRRQLQLAKEQGGNRCGEREQSGGGASGGRKPAPWALAAAPIRPPGVPDCGATRRNLAGAPTGLQARLGRLTRGAGPLGGLQVLVQARLELLHLLELRIAGGAHRQRVAARGGAGCEGLAARQAAAGVAEGARESCKFFGRAAAPRARPAAPLRRAHDCVHFGGRGAALLQLGDCRLSTVRRSGPRKAPGLPHPAVPHGAVARRGRRPPARDRLSGGCSNCWAAPGLEPAPWGLRPGQAQRCGPFDHWTASQHAGNWQTLPAGCSAALAGAAAGGGSGGRTAPLASLWLRAPAVHCRPGKARSAAAAVAAIDVLQHGPPPARRRSHAHPCRR